MPTNPPSCGGPGDAGANKYERLFHNKCCTPLLGANANGRYCAYSDSLITTFAGGIPVDSDDDFVPDIGDNCLTVKNTQQEDRDGDGIGDACDNCPDEPNLDQGDENQNGIGNACDSLDAGTD